MQRAPEPYGAIADPTRRAVLAELRRGDRTVGDLFGRTAAGRMSQPAFSQHLRHLRDAGLIRQHRRGRERVCTLTPGGLEDVARWLKPFEAYWEDKLDALGRHLDGRQG